MTKRITLDLGKGDLLEGFFQVTATLSAVGKSPLLCCKGSLPAAAKLDQVYKRWRLLYETLAQSLWDSRLEIEEGAIENFSEREFQQVCQDLKTELNNWLDSQEFLRDIESPLRSFLNYEEEVQIIIQTDNFLLRQFPWQLWNFIQEYPQSEMALSATAFKLSSQSQTSLRQIRVLAILGNSKGIDLQTDITLLQNILGNNLVFLNEPSRQELIEQLWDKQGWDIFFFAGHSRTEEETGVIYLNKTDKFTIDELSNALSQAISRGLQLAIFNSCDGLGLAHQLEKLHIPQIIVMRYPVPDKVAHIFLKYFITEFAAGNSLYQAVRRAREKLQETEIEFPCAGWLPILCQNPAVVPLTWKSLTKPNSSLSWKQGLKIILLLSIISTGIIMGFRSLGWLQALELKAYDLFMKLRPQEGIDTRLLLITITENDVQSQPASERAGASLSDKILEQLLIKLEQSSATAIGLDIYRENPVKQQYIKLSKGMRESQRFFGLCFYGEPGVIPPPEVPSYRHGFNNILLDDDDILRRNLLAVESPEPCHNSYSLSLQLAKYYISKTDSTYFFTPNNKSGYIQLEKTVFKTLDTSWGGYHYLDNRGHQILINYRNTSQIAETVTLNEFLENYPLEKIDKRIILIGTIAPSFNDHRWYTPIGKLTGIEIQAHLVSQLLSTILDRRPLIWTLPFWGNVVWIGFWSYLGGIFILKIKLPKNLFLTYGIILIILVGGSWILWLLGAWIPLVPSLLVIITTGGMAWSYQQFYYSKNQ